MLIDALEPFRSKGIENDNELLPYLQEKKAENVYDIRLQVELTPKDGKPTVVSNSNGKHLLFSFPQMLAHHTVGGCNMNVGDLLGKPSKMKYVSNRESWLTHCSNRIWYHFRA